MMKKLMNILFLSCLKATELIEKKIYFKLSLKEKIQLKAHKMMCDACTNYEKQSIFLDKGISHLHESEISKEDLEEFKRMIKRKLEN